MIIGIDANEANVHRKVGVGEFAFELLIQFHKHQSSNNFQIYLKNPPLDTLPKKKENWNYRVVKPSFMWTQFPLPLDLYVNRPRPDVFFTPTHYAPRFSPVPTVVSVMDLSYKFYPELFKKGDLYKLNSWTAYSVRNASRVITISQSSKNDIIKYYQVSREKVVVVYPGIKPKMSNQNPKLLKEKYNIHGDYILFVGTLQPRKNIEKLIEAFAKVVDKYSSSEAQAESRSNIKESSRQSSNNKSLQLIIIGKKGWMWEDILSAPKKFGVEEKVKFLDFVPDEDLPTFYQNALCFVLPSLYEGFGLPVLEAMKYGCPVAISNVSSLPEAGGDAAVYFNPQDVNDIAKVMGKLIQDEDLRREIREKGFKQVKKFSWEQAAKQTLEVLEEVGHAR